MTAQADAITTTIQVGLDPEGVAINPAGTFAYVANKGSNSVSKIDLDTNTEALAITVGSNPTDVAINRTGTFAWVTNSGSNSVSKIDLDTNQVTATISVGAQPRYIAINPAGTFAWVTNSGSNSVSKIDTASDMVTATISVGLWPQVGAINPAGTYIYVTNYTSRTVSKIGTDSDTVVATISVGSGPSDVAINPIGTFAYVVNAASDTVSKINLANDTVVATISVGSGPSDVAINPAGTSAYVTHYGSGTRPSIVSKINLVTNSVAATITVGSGPSDVAINPAGTFAYVANTTSGTVSKIALTATDPQSISFVGIGKSVIPAPLNQLLGANTVALSATASSTLTVAFTSTTATVCTVSGSTVTMLTIGDCTINANQSGGSGFDAAPQVSQTFTILSSPPPGEPGVSIKNGASYVNTKQVTLNLIWPEYATAARISNDGGFAASKTQTKDLAASIDWELDDSVQGIYTKVVYVRFNGVADTTKTYSDDIILDTSPPVVESSTAAAVSGSIDLTLKATDDITGVDKVQIKNGATTVTKDYAAKVSVPLADLLLSVSSMSVQKLAITSVEIRVSDKAGNWSAYAPLSVSSATAPTVTKSKSATAKSIAIFAKIPVLSTSKVSLKVVSGYAKFCKVSGAALKGLKAGTCKVTVTVTPKKGKAIPKTVTLKITN
jgi:YVTN family beta-propeller protein